MEEASKNTGTIRDVSCSPRETAGAKGESAQLFLEKAKKVGRAYGKTLDLAADSRVSLLLGGKAWVGLRENSLQPPQ